MHSHQFLRLNFNERQPFQQAKRHSSVNHFSFAFTYEIWLVTSPEFERAVFLYQTQIFRQEIRSVRMTVTWTASDLEFLDETKSCSSFISRVLSLIKKILPPSLSSWISSLTVYTSLSLAPSSRPKCAVPWTVYQETSLFEPYPWYRRFRRSLFQTYSLKILWARII